MYRSTRMIAWFRLLSALTLVLSTTAFQPILSRSDSVASTNAVQRMATIEKEDRMTKDDEDVLFGDPSEAHPPFPGKHRRISRTGNILEDAVAPANGLDHSSTNPLINKLHTMRETLVYCPQLWSELAKYTPDKRAVLDEHLCDESLDVSFAEMDEIVRKSAAAFANLGVRKGINVAVLGENSARWLMVDHGIQLAGGASAVRGADAPVDELRYIYEHSDSSEMVVLQGPRLLKKLASGTKAKGSTGSKIGLSNPTHGPVKTVILMHREKSTDEELTTLASELELNVYVFQDLLDRTAPLSSDNVPSIRGEDLATIVYTSGTTGNPKGVMLTHANMIHQMQHRLGPSMPYEETDPLPGEVMLSLLPVWHITERSFELWMFSRGCSVVYSSIRTFKNDLAKNKPHWIVLVPRVMEKVAAGVQDKFSSGSLMVKALSKLFTATGSARCKHKKIVSGLVLGDEKPDALQRLRSRLVLSLLAPLNAVGDKLVWSRVKEGFGGRLKVIIGGGSALAGSLESFYETSGLNVLVGYGLTECSPLISFRRVDCNLVTAGCAGQACYDTELRIVDPDVPAGDRERPGLSNGTAGVIVARGPQVTQGYYKDPENTAKAIDQFGWFNTGDLGYINPATGDLIITGRQKDTIVLSNGENIEPVPLEDAIVGESPLIEQAMLVGQDGRRLVAIVVLPPQELARTGYLSVDKAADLQDQYDKLNDPKCSEDDGRNASHILTAAGEELRRNQDLQSKLQTISRKATSPFRKWEQVSDVYLTLEPFAMVNGQLTQSYKVKRPSVSKRYQDQLPS